MIPTCAFIFFFKDNFALKFKDIGVPLVKNFTEVFPIITFLFMMYDIPVVKYVSLLKKSNPPRATQKLEASSSTKPSYRQAFYSNKIYISFFDTSW